MVVEWLLDWVSGRDRDGCLARARDQVLECAAPADDEIRTVSYGLDWRAVSHWSMAYVDPGHGEMWAKVVVVGTRCVDDEMMQRELWRRVEESVARFLGHDRPCGVV